MKSIPLETAPATTYHLVSRPGSTSPGAATMRDLIVETMRSP
jgi:hypothetical protein